MKLYFILFSIIFCLIWKANAQIEKSYPVLDRRVEKVKRPNTATLSTAKIPNQISSKALFSDSLAFEAGDARLSIEGEEQLDRFIIEIDAAIQTFRKAYPTSPLLLKISIAEEEKWHCVLCSRRTNEIYQYLMERLVQAGNVQIQKEITKIKMPKPQELSSIVSVDNLLENQK